jgi:hypothetical protein
LVRFIEEKIPDESEEFLYKASFEEEPFYQITKTILLNTNRPKSNG